jgi:hypothetical protein
MNRDLEQRNSLQRTTLWSEHLITLKSSRAVDFFGPFAACRSKLPQSSKYGSGALIPTRGEI